MSIAFFVLIYLIIGVGAEYYIVILVGERKSLSYLSMFLVIFFWPGLVGYKLAQSIDWDFDE